MASIGAGARGSSETSAGAALGSRSPPLPKEARLRELTRSNDLVFLSWLTATLRAKGVEAIVLDAHTSVIEGSIGAIQRRVLVADEDLAAARTVLDEAREDGFH